MSGFRVGVSLALIAIPLVGCPPVSPNVSIEPEAPTTLDELRVVLDPPTPEAEFVWLQQGVVQDDLTGVTVPADRTAKGQAWTVQVKDGDRELGEAEITIVNAQPTAVVTLPERATAGRDLVATVEGEDPDGDVILYRYQWKVDGADVGGDTESLAASFLQPRGATISVDVTPFNDGDSEVGETVSATSTVGNAAPEMETATLVHDGPVREASVLTCVGSGWSDEDGDPEGYHVKWFVNGSMVSDSEALDGSSFDKGDEVYCEMFPWDGNIEGDSVNSDSVFVENTPPEIGNLEISPTEGIVLGSTVTATLSGVVDVDGDELTETIQWKYPVMTGTQTETHPGGLLIESRHAHKSFQVVAIVSDGEDETADYAAFDVENLPPEVKIVSVSPRDLKTGVTPSVSTTAADPEGDAISFTHLWTVNGKAVSSTGAECIACEHVRGDTVTVVVTGDDGPWGGEDSDTYSWTVVNTEPTPPGVTLSPSSGALGEDVFCEVTTPSTDADGDSITYTIEWTHTPSGGAPTAYSGSTTTTDYAGDTIPSDVLRLEDTWKCKVTAYDGTASNYDSSSSVRFRTCSPLPPSGLVIPTAPRAVTKDLGYCFYLTKPGQTCDATCGWLGGTNLAKDAVSDLVSAVGAKNTCGAPQSRDITEYFYTTGNPGGWTSRLSRTIGERSLGQGHGGGAFTGVCDTGTTDVGAWPGTRNTSMTRSLVCACF